MNFAMALDYQNCINCKACEIACKEENGVQLGADKQRIWVGVTENSIFGRPILSLYPSQCNHCVDAPCVDVCPTNASHFADGGLVLVDQEKCILCKGCMEACPYDARFVDDKVAAVDKCTFCFDTRISQGKATTACQATCPTKVRLFGDLDDEEGELVQLLKSRKFFVLKENEGTVPKLFYLFPEHDDHFAQNSIGHETTIHTWETFKPLIDMAKAKRSKQWTSL
ncbi:4Fe-4S dicluster domain-containing protein [Sulfurimonas sp.]|uniref:4Fe-4S dicluster domain-containing protein n=1 Tax=Sulfurimonas sp. TaxID=2022749 RepID=UPI002636FAF1|nr:4Fe-4S dicluster domain-containing protein [Sulfurimonas sp.]